MSIFLTLAFLFFIGSSFGWILELFYRRFFSGANPERKWINPGFCVGPYIPLYGVGLCILFLVASLPYNRAILFVIMAFSLTAIEYLAGILCIKLCNVRLWDYSSLKGNIQGIICPHFSAIWAAMGAVYYFLIHPHILDALHWLSENLAFSFVLGMFYGFFIIDVIYSSNLVVKLRKFAIENDVIVRYEMLKAHIRSRHDAANKKPHFLFPFRSELSLSEHLEEMHEKLERRPRKSKNKNKL